MPSSFRGVPSILQPITAEQFDRFKKLIYEQCGIRLDDRKLTLLSRRLKPLLKELGMDSVDHYYQLVKSPKGKDELIRLLTAVTTNETSFYRTQPHFDWFQNQFIEEVLNNNRAGKHPQNLRIWSAACSVGAEPYTLAFCIAEKRLRFAGWKISILGTDISELSLGAAKAARYRMRMLTGLPDTKLNRYFRQIEGSTQEYEVRSEYREMVDFRRHNLMDPIAERPFHCIFLRNVLIYFDTQSKQSVLHNMAAALAPGGYLVIGPSEGIYGLENPLEKVSTFLYRKN